MNKVEISGRLAQDVAVESTANGYSFMNFAIAKDGIKYDPASGGNVVKAQYIDCQIKGKYAAEVGNLSKGSEVHAIGELTQDTWQDQQGNNRSKLRVNIIKLEVLVSGSFQSGQQSAPAPAQPQAPAGDNFAEQEAPF